MKNLKLEVYGAKIEILEEDFPKKMTKEEAETACCKLGAGWRLPDLDETGVIYREICCKNKGNFHTNSTYWISTNSPDDFPLTFDFSNGKTFMGDLSFKENVRPVKSLDWTDEAK